MQADIINNDKARLALLTPYGGGNLGDGAIQIAAMEGLRRHFPNAEFTGITLNPAQISRLHGIPAFPITGLRVSFYSETLFEPTSGIFVKFAKQSKDRNIETHESSKEIEAPSEMQDTQGIWEKLKTLPILGVTLLFLLRITRRFFIILHELHDLTTSYKFVKNLDAIIVSGGGQLDELWGGAWGHPYALLRWAVLSKLTGKQFIIISVGVGELNTKLGRFFTKTALSLACYRSYRDLDSKELLKAWAFTSSDPCVPDLALGLMSKKSKAPEVSEKNGLVVGISPIAFGHETSWPTPTRDVYTRYVTTLAAFISQNILNQYKPVFFTSSSTDRQVVNEILKQIELSSANFASSTALPPPTISSVIQLINTLNEVDIVIASRLHSVILSHTLRKPVVAISFDRKVDTHMRDMGQNEYILDIHNFSQQELLDKLNHLIANMTDIKKTLENNITKAEVLIKSQYNQLALLINTKVKHKSLQI